MAGGHFRAPVTQADSAHPGSPLPAGAQDVLANLATGVAGQGIGLHPHVLGHLEVGQPSRAYPTSADRSTHAGRAARPPRRPARRAVDPTPQHRHLADSGCRGQHVLHLDAVHVLAPAIDHVLHPVDQIDPAVAIDTGEITRVQPAVANGCAVADGLRQ